MIVAYVRSSLGEKSVCEVQKNIIDRYLKRYGLHCQQYFEDLGKVKRGAPLTRQMTERGFLEFKEYDRIYPEYERMLCFIQENPVKAIIVDLRSRLYMMNKQNKLFLKICREKGIQIIEAISDEPMEKEEGKKSVAIYHFTNQSEQRPVIFEKEIDRLYQYTSQQKCWDVPYVFVDYSLRKSLHEKYNCFRRSVVKFDVLLVTDYFHLEDKLGTFIKEMKELNQHGVEVISLKEGKVKFFNQELLEKSMAAVFYGRMKDSQDIEIEMEIVRVFLTHKTKWTLQDIYIEETVIERDSEQKKLPLLMNNDCGYEVVLLKKFNHLQWRTSMFFKIMKQLKVPVYSITEGGIYFEEAGNI